DPGRGQARLPRDREGDRPRAQSAGGEGAVPSPESTVALALRARPGSRRRQGLPALALRRQAAVGVARLRRRLLRAVPPRLRQPPDVESRAALHAYKESLK